MNDEQLGPIVSSWLKEENRPPARPEESVRTAMTAARTTPQLRRWRWLPWFAQRPPEAPPTAPDIDHMSDLRSTPIPATNGHTPTVIGRTTSMLSPVKAVTIGALVFAIGGTFLIAQPFDQQATLPGAEAEAVDPTWVTGKVHWAPRPCTGPESELDGDVRRDRNHVCRPMRWEASDPRLNGTVTLVEHEDVYQVDDRSVTVATVAEFLENDEGGWACADTGHLYQTDVTAVTYAGTPTSTCAGNGGYEGLSALLVFDPDDSGFEGLIFAGDLPPVPERPADE